MPQVREISDSSILGRSVWVGNCHHEVFDGHADSEQIKQASALWDRLVQDEYLHDKGSYRQRRYAEMIYHADSDELSITDNKDFYQSQAYNAANGGVRTFSLIDKDFLSSALLQKILRHFGARFAAELGTNRLELYLHQVRIIGRAGEAGQPTPEGIHKDGVDFSCQVLFGRRNVEGGESIIYDNQRTPLLGTTMLEPLDFYCFKDPDIYHSVTPIVPQVDDQIATRDILGIEFCVKRERHAG